jgi:hypothetical protein
MSVKNCEKHAEAYPVYFLSAQTSFKKSNNEYKSNETINPRCRGWSRTNTCFWSETLLSAIVHPYC